MSVEHTQEEFKRNLTVFDPLPADALITPRQLVMRFDGSLVLDNQYYALRVGFSPLDFRTVFTFRVNRDEVQLDFPQPDDPIFKMDPDKVSKQLVWRVGRTDSAVSTPVDQPTSSRLDSVVNRRHRYHSMYVSVNGHGPINEKDSITWKIRVVYERMPVFDELSNSTLLDDWKRMVTDRDNSSLEGSVDQSLATLKFERL